MFDITISSDKFFNDWNELVVRSKIKINCFSEDFYLPISYWDINEYKKCWIESLYQFLNKNRDRAALITSMYDLEKTNFLHSWIIYGKDNIAFIQNCILFRDNFDTFSLENILKHIPDREIYSESGERISEWKTNLKHIINFYNKLKFELSLK